MDDNVFDFEFETEDMQSCEPKSNQSILERFHSFVKESSSFVSTNLPTKTNCGLIALTEDAPKEYSVVTNRFSTPNLSQQHEFFEDTFMQRLLRNWSASSIEEESKQAKICCHSPMERSLSLPDLRNVTSSDTHKFTHNKSDFMQSWSFQKDTSFQKYDSAMTDDILDVTLPVINQLIGQKRNADCISPVTTPQVPKLRRCQNSDDKLRRCRSLLAENQLMLHDNTLALLFESFKHSLHESLDSSMASTSGFHAPDNRVSENIDGKFKLKNVPISFSTPKPMTLSAEKKSLGSPLCENSLMHSSGDIFVGAIEKEELETAMKLSCNDDLPGLNISTDLFL